MLRITVLFFLLVVIVFGQRSSLEKVVIDFDQPNEENVDYWRVIYSEDNIWFWEIEVQKNDTNLVIEPASWWDEYFEDDTTHLTYKLWEYFEYDKEYYFWATAVNNLGEAKSEVVPALFFKQDLNNDKSIDGLDLIELVNPENWGRTGVGFSFFIDINADGSVDGLDLIELVHPNNWGRHWVSP